MDIEIVATTIGVIMMSGVLFCCVSLGIVQVKMLKNKYVRPENKRMHFLAMGLIVVIIVKSFSDLVEYLVWMV